MQKITPQTQFESQRLASLESYKMMDTAPEADFEELVQLASEICGTPIALITLVDDTRQWFKSKVGLEVNQTPKEQAFCAHTIVDSSGFMQIRDARTDLRFSNNPLVTSAPNIVFYAGISLLAQDGMPLGTLCVIDRVPKELTDRQLNAMKILAKQVMAQMELRKQLAGLKELNKQLSETNEFMQRFATTAAHDIKNPLSNISLSAELLIRHLKKNDDDKGLKFANTNLNAAKHLAKLVSDMLAYSLRPEILTQNHHSFPIIIFLQKVVSMITMPKNVKISYPENGLHITTSEIALQQLFINLLTNAIRYNDKQTCCIKISCAQNEMHTQFIVEDNGIGIANNELERIFDRNVTLNQSDRFKQSSTGIGLHTVRVLLEKLGGKISVESELTKGSRFIFTIPSPN
ncbi:GAF domain-containing sensor histidine kinase [Pedobacter namyangjuensis]|uniref:GAF domain-containing sensor histidine kinase n=1 Tax=Pedobacter namyangjuensis TaxID=600626 RepID=UPI0013B3D625|nr:GAF domain-containing sensor histidine kinase [Pedobacter namyangjuensis]